MEKAELLGRHTHTAVGSTSVNVWRRGASFIARGYYHGSQFGETLGRDQQAAEHRLHELISEIGQGTYVLPSETTRRHFPKPTSKRLTIRQLFDEFLVTKRKLCGQRTAGDYRTRLAPVVEFAETDSARKKWSTAASVDQDFAIEFRSWLFDRRVTRNGRAASPEKLISPHQVYNVLDCARTAFNWAKNVRVAKLPASFLNPFNEEIVGRRPRKDPLRKSLFPIERRIQLVGIMDEWQLSHLALSTVLPLRPEDCAALLINEIDYGERLIRFGTRFEGRDFNKARLSFACPYPEQLEPFLRFCQASRLDGPLLRRRTVFEGRRLPDLRVVGRGDAAARVKEALERAPATQRETLQDQKQLIRRAVRRMGGVSKDELAKEFKEVVSKVGLDSNNRFYDLRSAVNTDMERAGLSTLVQKYITGHATSDILYEYVSLDVGEAMRKYFDRIKPLLEAMRERAHQLRLRLPI